MSRLAQEAVDQWNRRLAQDYAAGDSTAHVHVECAFTEDWLSQCSDRECYRPHHFGLVSCSVRRYDQEWPLACVGMRRDEEEVVLDLTKPQLAAYIADLKHLFESLP